MFKKIILICLTSIFFIYSPSSFSIENKILVKIDNQIITSLDVNNEYKYLIALNPSLKNSKKEDIIKLSKRSIINERIKKIEIEKNFNNPQIPEKFLDIILQNVYFKIGIENISDFKRYLSINDIDFENVKNKLEIEALWNELILIKFSSKININEDDLRKKIKENNKFSKSYLLSEISFEVSNLSDLESKYTEIRDVINNKGFDFAALKYSISATSKIGGKLDWINENSLNKQIKDAIKNLKINDFTKPINASSGFLILKINDVKSTQIEVSVEDELKKLTNYEKNNQLNQYSKIYFNKVKKNLQIDEL
jgi:peptidyl-prolyl cis-trans isomerase SurA